MIHSTWFSFLDLTSDLNLYLLLTLSALLENLAPFLPGDLTLFWAGALVSIGRIDPVAAVGLLSLGMWFGFMVFYELARILPRSPLCRRLLSRVPEPGRDRVSRYTRAYGLWVVAVHRLVPGLRTAVAVVTGFSALSRLRVGSLSLLSILLWNSAFIGFGRWLELDLKSLVQEVSSLPLSLPVALAVAAAGALGYRAWQVGRAPGRWDAESEPLVEAALVGTSLPSGQPLLGASLPSGQPLEGGAPPWMDPTPPGQAPEFPDHGQPAPDGGRPAPTPGDIPDVDDPLLLGIDVGSTTVKVVVVHPYTMEILWQDYRRHHTHQADTLDEFLQRIEAEYPLHLFGPMRAFVTGSGAQPLAEPLGARFVQEVNAVTLAVERLHPEVRSVAELGGQDAKIILFRGDEDAGDRMPFTSMNDRCASGTGATIDKCLLKVGLTPEGVQGVRMDGRRLHHVAAKCGVFAEMDIVNLVKSGVPPEEVLCSLGDAIVQQNISLLARGNTLKPPVLLLGGPLFHLPFLQDAWRQRLRETWEERGVDYPREQPLESLIVVPEQALYFAAYGAAVYGARESRESGRYRGRAEYARILQERAESRHGGRAGPGLVRDEAELEAFRAAYALPPFQAPVLPEGSVVRAALGVDGGSTSTKAVLLGEDGTVLRKAYRLSKGNPIQDVKELLAELKASVTAEGARLDVTAFGVTGYAAGVLEQALRADVNTVETIAHMRSAVTLFGDVNVICDVGGQDIKVLFMQNGELRNFRLSNQCSAGNGMLLQATAGQFDVPIEQFAECAFRARVAPQFSYGCAVFLDSDRVNFQKEGFTRDELMAGLAMVLPKNIWQYVVQIPRMSALGRRYVLQGGTQYNLAAVKAQVDYIRERVPDADIHLHPHPGEAGAIGTAMEAWAAVRERGHSTFVGLDQAIDIAFATRTDESTRCAFCTNNCARTFIETRTPDGTSALYISGFSCERGTVPDVEALKAFNRDRRERARQYPNLALEEAQRLFARGLEPEPLPAPGIRLETVKRARHWMGPTCFRPVRKRFRRSSAADAAYRAEVRIGMPRCLDFWNSAPFWRAYFETLGIAPRHLVFSRESGERMFADGAKYGAVDPCYPAKVVQAHVHQLLFDPQRAHKPLHYMFFPTVNQTLGHGIAPRPHACPVVAGTGNVIKAAFTKEFDYFADQGITYVDGVVNFGEPEVLEEQIAAMWCGRLRVTRDESDFAVTQGYRAMEAFNREMQAKGRALLEDAEREDRYCVLLLARPYHLDPGMHHGILEVFQSMGYPVLTLRSLPKDPAWLARWFRDDLVSGRVAHPMDIGDVWPEAHTGNSALKVWGAKFAARHPHVAVVDLSSFKCGHDAPTYGLIDAILTAANVPFLALHDLDANRPTGTLQIRIRTFVYALHKREQSRLAGAEGEALLARRLRERAEAFLRRLAPDTPPARAADEGALSTEGAVSGDGRGT